MKHKKHKCGDGCDHGMRLMGTSHMDKAHAAQFIGARERMLAKEHLLAHEMRGEERSMMTNMGGKEHSMIGHMMTKEHKMLKGVRARRKVIK